MSNLEAATQTLDHLKEAYVREAQVPAVLTATTVGGSDDKKAVAAREEGSFGRFCAKEKTMNIADILIHVHPELSAEQRAKIEGELGGRDGVVSVHFSPGHPHLLTVAYDPQTITSRQILDAVRRWDEAATMAGL